jgi:hypothetical protein
MNNQKLLDQILNHIYGNLGLTRKVATPITTDAFCLKESLLFSDEDGDHKALLWSAQTDIGATMKILCADFSLDNYEYALIVELEKCPAYGCYLCLDKFKSNKEVYDGLLTFFSNGKWLVANTYLQATFLAGMESVKNFNAPWVPGKDYNLIEKMKSFISFYESQDSFNE